MERARRNVAAIPLSALSGDGCDHFLENIEEEITQGSRVLKLELDSSEGAALAWLHQHSNVVDQKLEHSGEMRLSVILDEADEARFYHRFGRSVTRYG